MDNLTRQHRERSRDEAYVQALAILSQAEREQSTLTYDGSRQALVVQGGSAELRARIASLTGVMTLDLREQADAAAAVEAERAAAVVPELIRTSRADHLVTVVHLAHPGRRALAQMVTAPSLAARELLAWPAANLAGLPVPFTLHLERRPPAAAQQAYGAVAQPFVVTSSRIAYARAQASSVPAFVVRELEAMALAAELERAYPRDLDQWLAQKRSVSGWCVTHEVTGALEVRGVTAEMRSTWTLGRTLDELGAELVSVELHETKGEA